MGSKEPREEEKTSEDGIQAKKKYQTPKILSREPLEAMAALCRPTPPGKATVGACPRGPISS